MWFTKEYLLQLPPTFIFIMNNASIHLILMEMVPCANIRQANTMVWLSSKHIAHLPQQKHKINPVNTMHWTPLSSYTVTQWCNCSHITATSNQYHSGRQKPIHNTRKLIHEATDRIQSVVQNICVHHTDKLQEQDF